jgi:hypothetical protein
MKIFLVLPYKREFEDIYESVKMASSLSGHTITRAEDFENEDDIVKKVNDAIDNSDLVVADVSNFSKGDNVIDEFVKAQTSGKPIIPICIKSEEIPIDLSNYKSIIYDRLRLQETLVRPLIKFLQEPKPLDFLQRRTKEKKTTRPVKSIFVSYSHIDLAFLERLRIHLKPFEKKGQIDLWVDTKIKAGEKWKEKISAALDTSVIAILLISADFLASDFIVDNELPPLLKAAEENGKVILPLIVKPCRFTSDENLSKFQSINDPKIPLSKLSENDREEIYVKVADFIDNLVK